MKYMHHGGRSLDADWIMMISESLVYDQLYTTKSQQVIKVYDHQKIATEIYMCPVTKYETPETAFCLTPTVHACLESHWTNAEHTTPEYLLLSEKLLTLGILVQHTQSITCLSFTQNVIVFASK